MKGRLKAVSQWRFFVASRSRYIWIDRYFRDANCRGVGSEFFFSAALTASLGRPVILTISVLDKPRARSALHHRTNS